MSGGSYNYIYSRLRNECEGNMFDPEMDELIHDLCDVLHDLEWWQSGDKSETEYRTSVFNFKRKWFHAERNDRLKKYIDEQTRLVRDKLYKILDVEEDESNAEGDS